MAKLYEGVFAIHKPPSISSAQVLRDLQHSFAKSTTFAPLLEQTESQIQQDGRRSKRRRISKDNVFKMGHGGTLDPLATGVLIVGIGRGTKHLQGFLECTKTYDTVVLFGKSTDTYDIAGKIIEESKHEHITKQLVEEKLSSFRGRIKQTPPMYSALKIDGVKAYEYARLGKEMPRQLQPREMNVSECELLEWYDGGSHEFRWPKEKGEFVSVDKSKEDTLSREVKQALHTHDTPELESEPAIQPAAKIRLTVSSGFYVRSFAYDLGLACQSFGTMAELIRTRQGDYSLEDSITAITYDDFMKGEEVWGDQLKPILSDWMEENPIVKKPDDRDRPDKDRFERPRFEYDRKRKVRRNSSSPES